MAIPILSFLFGLVVTSHATCPSDYDNVRSLTDQIHILRPKSGAAGRKIPDIDCLSWRLTVETDNIRNWVLLPSSCEDYVGHYMLGKQYRKDCEAVADVAIEYAKTLNLSGNRKEIWVFDIDETTLSNMPYYARSDVQFGALPYNGTRFGEWVATGEAPAIPAVRRLYKTVLALGIKPVFISGTKEQFRQIRISNLYKAGYRKWDKLILKGPNEPHSAVEYKSNKRTELVKAGYIIVGNIGDQWSDLIGTNVGSRTFKVPDPMYFIS